LLDLAREEKPEKKALEEVQRQIQRRFSIAEEGGYKVEALLDAARNVASEGPEIEKPLLTPESAEKPK